MKKIILLVVLLSAFAVSASAQYAGTLRRVGANLVGSDGTLTEAQVAQVLSNIGGSDYNQAWKEAKSKRGVGTGLTIGGGVLLGGGLITALLGGATSLAGASTGGIFGGLFGGQQGAEAGAEAGAATGAPIAAAGLIASAVGVVGLAVGIPLCVSGSRKMDGIVGDYNSKVAGNTAQLTFGATTNGVGLSLSF